MTADDTSMKDTGNSVYFLLLVFFSKLVNVFVILDESVLVFVTADDNSLKDTGNFAYGYFGVFFLKTC